MTNLTIRGQFNELLSLDIGDNTIISGWTFIGKGVKIGKGCHFGNYVNIDSGAEIGDNCNFQLRVYIPSNTVIGDNCFFAGHAAIADEKYPTVGEQVRRTVTIGKNVIVGIGAKIVGVDVGDNAVIGAQSLVLKPVPANEVWAGNPAKFVMSRGEFDRKKAAWEAKEKANHNS